MCKHSVEIPWSCLVEVPFVFPCYGVSKFVSSDRCEIEIEVGEHVNEKPCGCSIKGNNEFNIRFLYT